MRSADPGYPSKDPLRLGRRNKTERIPGNKGAFIKRKSLTLEYYISKMGSKEKNLTNFIRTVISVFPLFIAMSFACSFHTRQQDIIKDFQDFFRTRVREFVQGHKGPVP